MLWRAHAGLTRIADMQVEQQQAALAIRHVFEGMALPAALAAVDDGEGRRGRTLVQELAYGTLRHWGRLDALTRGTHRGEQAGHPYDKSPDRRETEEEDAASPANAPMTSAGPGDILAPWNRGHVRLGIVLADGHRGVLPC